MPEHIKAYYKSLRWQIPYLDILLGEMTHKSPVELDLQHSRETVLFGDQIFKAYSLKKMLKEKDLQHTFYTEYAILKQATLGKCQNILQLNRLCFGEDHLALNFSKYQMSFREYLDEKRQPS